MLDDVKALGNPEVENGEAIGRDVRSGLAPLQEVIEDARRDAAAIPDDPEGFEDGLQEVVESFGADLGTWGDELTTKIQKYDARELAEAFHR